MTPPALQAANAQGLHHRPATRAVDGGGSGGAAGLGNGIVQQVQSQATPNVDLK